MGCATGALKVTLCILNILSTILGIYVILFGALGWGAMPQIYAIGIIALGLVLVLISFFGCFGTLRESPRILWTYIVFLLILLILVVVFMLISKPDVFKKYALEGVEYHWKKELKKSGAMDTIQTTYSCCGRNSPEDYITIQRLPPASCCVDHNCINPLNLYITGCLAKVENSFSDEEIIMKYNEWGLIGFDIIILVIATVLAIHYTNRRRRYSY
ncbi:protein late bloomer-like [Teleopsis dalmanni]|uniref:protein late bloomer-like n=1 Tax=Teleopsis dalmanni TaxID=139649 RepID=UPI0018CF36F3|nr:protein late bloomer-like [Teleopsis dalmanni]